MPWGVGGTNREVSSVYAWYTCGLLLSLLGLLATLAAALLRGLVARLLVFLAVLVLLAAGFLCLAASLLSLAAFLLSGFLGVCCESKGYGHHGAYYEFLHIV